MGCYHGALCLFRSLKNSLNIVAVCCSAFFLFFSFFKLINESFFCKMIEDTHFGIADNVKMQFALFLEDLSLFFIMHSFNFFHCVHCSTVISSYKKNQA